MAGGGGEENKTVSQFWAEVSEWGSLYLHHIKEYVGVRAQLLGIPDAVFVDCKAHVLEDESMWFCGNKALHKLWYVEMERQRQRHWRVGLSHQLTAGQSQEKSSLACPPFFS